VVTAVGVRWAVVVVVLVVVDGVVIVAVVGVVVVGVVVVGVVVVVEDVAVVAVRTTAALLRASAGSWPEASVTRISSQVAANSATAPAITRRRSIRTRPARAALIACPRTRPGPPR
jgi:hypothetical protein